MEREPTTEHGVHHDATTAAALRVAGVAGTVDQRPQGALREPPRHPVRAKIQAYVHEHPGVHMGDLVRDLGLGWGNAHHHLDHMERKTQIMREPEGNRVRLFVPGQIPAPLRHAFAVLKNESLRDTFRTVVERPGIIQRDVATALGVTPTAARKHLRRLGDEGLIRAERTGNRVRYRATADAIGLELRLWLRSDRLSDPSPRRAHPNEPTDETAADVGSDAAAHATEPDGQTRHAKR